MPLRQEQEDAKTEVTEVAPGVLRMQLPISMPGLGHVNCYALVDDRGCALVDPGLPGQATWRALQDRLKQAGLRTSHVHTVIVTHSHPDHFGGANRFVKEAGAKVIGHRNFRFGQAEAAKSDVSVEDLSAVKAAQASETEREPKQRTPGPTWRTTTPWGGAPPRPPLARRIAWKVTKVFGGGFVPEITDPVEHGNALQLAGREWFVLHTPGHTEDHICLHDPEYGVFIGGDHVLPSITPHISGLATSRDPLASFFYSLDRVAEISGIKVALPAHGHPFDDLRGRSNAIKRHHYERLEKIREIARELGPATVEDISKKLFRERSWGSMAESETYAHLEHLRIAGNAESHRGSSGKLIYELG